MINLPLYTIGERRPKHNEHILVFGQREDYGNYDIQFHRIEYSWEELDEDGDTTGSWICFHGMSKKPRGNVRLILQGNNGEVLPESTVYTTIKGLESAYLKFPKNS